MNLLQKVRLWTASKLLGTMGQPPFNPNNPHIVSMNSNLGIVTWSGANAQSFVNDGFAGNETVYSVIKMVTDKAKLAPWHAYKIKDERKYLQYREMTLKMQNKDFVAENIKQARELKQEALQPYDGDDRLNELLKFPNDADSWSDMIEAWGAYKLTTGNAFTAADLIQAGNNKGKPLSLFQLPAQYTSIRADINRWPPVAVGYQLYIGVYYLYDKADVLHDRNVNLRADASGLYLYGMSPLQPGSRIITRNNESKKAAVANLVNGGPASIVSLNPPTQAATQQGFVTTQVAELKRRILEFSGADNKNKVAISGYPVDVKQLGLSNVDLDIIKGEMWDLRLICNLLGVPSQLLNDPENKAEANAKEAEKALTVRAALPLLYGMETNLNRKFSTDWGYKGTGIVVCPDLSVYQELQEDKKTKFEWVKDLPVTNRQKLQMMDVKPEDVSEDILNMVTVSNQVNHLDDSSLELPKDLDPYKE